MWVLISFYTNNDRLVKLSLFLNNYPCEVSSLSPPETLSNIVTRWLIIGQIFSFFYPIHFFMRKETGYFNTEAERGERVMRNCFCIYSSMRTNMNLKSWQWLLTLSTSSTHEKNRFTASMLTLNMYLSQPFI